MHGVQTAASSPEHMEGHQILIYYPQKYFTQFLYHTSPWLSVLSKPLSSYRMKTVVTSVQMSPFFAESLGL